MRHKYAASCVPHLHLQTHTTLVQLPCHATCYKLPCFCHISLPFSDCISPLFLCPFLISLPLSKRFVKFEFQARHKSLISAHSFPSTSDLPQCRVSCAVCCLPRPRHPHPSLHGTTNDMTVGYLSGTNTCGKSEERASNKLGASRKTTCHRLAVSLNHAAPLPLPPLYSFSFVCLSLN